MVLQPCYSLVLRCLDPRITGEVPVWCYSPATAWSSGAEIPESRVRCLRVLQPCYSLVLRYRCLDPGIMGEVPVCDLRPRPDPGQTWLGPHMGISGVMLDSAHQMVPNIIIL